ncbi:MAG: metallophosphoesterase, partial [Actinobacteria bacterium]|nr:metallophosphoesterase [Actinomycetota bacterium]
MARISRPAIERVARILVPVLVGVAGAWLGMAAWGAATVSMGPFRVQLDATFGPSVTDVALPPFGRLTADTHLAPLRLTATLQDVEVARLKDALLDRGLEDLAATVERDATDRLWRYALRVLGVALAGALALSALAFRRNRRAIEIAFVAAVVAVGGSEALAAVTYRSSAFLSPSFSGSLALAPELIGPVEEATERIGYFRTELKRIVDGAIRAYTSVEVNPLGKGDEIRVLHISDIHLSPLGYGFAREIAEGFDVDLVIDTGDTTSFGTPAEDLIVSYIPRFDRPYLFVRGNHDSIALQAEIARIPNAIVLDGKNAEVAGLTVYGLGDPNFVSNRGQPTDERATAERARAAGATILSALEELPAPPDIVAVHDDRMAEAVAGRVPVVISGHFHENTVRVVDGTLYLRIGTTGGAGPTAFTAEGGVPLSVEILYFEPGPP